MKRPWTLVIVVAVLVLPTACLGFQDEPPVPADHDQRIVPVRKIEVEHGAKKEEQEDELQEPTLIQDSESPSTSQNEDAEEETEPEGGLTQGAVNQPDQTSESLNGSSPSSDQENQKGAALPQTDQQSSSPAVDGHSPFSTAPKELEPGRSYMVAGLHLSEGAQFIPPGSTANPFQAYSTTRVFGSFELAKEIRRFKTRIDYKGGGFFYRDTGSPWSKYEVQQLTVTEDVSWQRTRFTLEDSISDFPGSSFSSAAFGGSGSYTLGFGGSSGSSDFFGFNDFGGLGAEQHITNVALASVTQQITPRSGIVLAGADAITHYFGNNSISSQQASGLMGYYYNVSQRTTASILYGYQYWTFAANESTNADTAQLTVSRQFSRRLNLSVGAGPQVIRSHNISEGMAPLSGIPVSVPITSRQIGFTANGYLAYNLRRQTLNVFYEHLLTSGSGLYAGANSDIATATLMRPMFRFWATTVSCGFVHLSSIGSGSAGILGNSYQYGFASFGVQHRLGSHVNILGSYQFNDATNTATCTPATGCGQIVHTVLFNLSWHTLPISLDRGSYRDSDTSMGPSAARSLDQVPAETN